VPFVLGGSAALLASWRSRRHQAGWVWALAAGCSGAAAALVKQNVVDVFVLAIAVTLVSGRGRTWSDLFRLACVGSGAAVTALVAIGYAWSRGTDPAALWDAVVTFRFDATSVIRSSANAATGMRFQHLLRELLVSGAPVVVLAAAWRMRGPAPPPLPGSGTGLLPTPAAAPDLRWPAAAVLAWELIAVGMGGSYWSHYLIGIVPGLILVVVAAGQRSPDIRTASWWIAPALTWATLVAIVGVITLGTRFSPGHGVDAQTVAYLRSHDAVGDTIVVAFGHPDIVEETGMSSPYPELWSLPVRVRDNQLRQLNGVLAGPSRPTWVVVSGETLTTWGVDTAVAQATLEHGYREVAVTDTYRIYHVRALRS
jgi:4-amino-4-deoxy-L-arabinose transferase-like glycosyltransferase